MEAIKECIYISLLVLISTMMPRVTECFQSLQATNSCISLNKRYLPALTNNLSPEYIKTSEELKNQIRDAGYDSTHYIEFYESYGGTLLAYVKIRVTKIGEEDSMEEDLKKATLNVLSVNNSCDCEVCKKWSGWYPCPQVNHPGGESRCSLNLCIPRKCRPEMKVNSTAAASNPKITYISTGALPIIDSAMGSVEFVKGSAVTLICSATGDPQPSFKWFYQEELSNTTEVLNGHRDNPSVLYLDNIQKPGYYECQASNILNQLNDPPSKVLRITLSEKSGNSITKKADDCPTRPMTNITNRDQKDNSITHKNFSKTENSSITPITDTSNTDQNFTGQVVSAVIIILIVLIVLAFILKNKPWQLFKGADNIPLSLEVVDKD